MLVTYEQIVEGMTHCEQYMCLSPNLRRAWDKLFRSMFDLLRDMLDDELNLEVLIYIHHVAGEHAMTNDAFWSEVRRIDEAYANRLMHEIKPWTSFLGIWRRDQEACLLMLHEYSRMPEAEVASIVFGCMLEVGGSDVPVLLARLQRPPTVGDLLALRPATVMYFHPDADSNSIRTTITGAKS